MGTNTPDFFLINADDEPKRKEVTRSCSLVIFNGQ